MTGVRWSAWTLPAALLMAAAALLLVASRGPASPRSLEDRVHAVASGLRCPVCQNLSVADSPSRLAREMRREIAAELRAGRSPEEVREGFVAAYGEWVLLSPPLRGVGLVAWALPVVLFAAGLALLGWLLRRWAGPRDRLPEGVP